MKMRSESIEQTRACGAGLARRARCGEVYGLVGELGTGKTEFARGFVAALDPGAPVRSPSFSLVNTYITPALRVHHFDFYRLTDQEELCEIGFDEYLADDAVCLIEWADMFPGALPPHARVVRFTAAGEDCRDIDMPD
jgi:tRNA threonylcarbamoyladenosine biosynthesis protein TsaE